MRKYTDLRPAQIGAFNHVCKHPMSMVWMDMGLGKTVSVLTAIRFLQMTGLVRAAVVFAPLRVAYTVWPQEIYEWKHLASMRVSPVLGTPAQRMNALMTPADLYVVNYENLPWFVTTMEDVFLRNGQYPPFDFAAFDEVDKMKDSANVRSTSWRRLAPYIPRRVGMTGTPSNEGLMDLHGQFRAIDDGVRLGTSKTAFERDYFYKERFNLIPYDDSAAVLEAKYKDIVYSRQREAGDRKLVTNDVRVYLPTALQAEYTAFKRSLVLDTAMGDEITAANAAVLHGKLKQWCGGAVYDNGDTGNWVQVHDAKMQALDSVVSETGTPLLVAYNYRHEMERILAKYPHAKTVHDYRDPTKLESEWNGNRIPLLVAHPASIGHGMNLQKGAGHTLCWYSLPDSSRLYQQMCDRLDRSGQQNDVVMNHRLITPMPIETDAAMALEMKADYQTAMRNSVEREMKNHMRATP